MVTMQVEQGVEVPQTVIEAWEFWRDACEGRTPAETLSVLFNIAEAFDQPLCEGYLCCTPHELTLRTCCQRYLCAECSDVHDDPEEDQCADFLAQLREEAGL